jgi:DNA-binding response OmpR family regulator
MDAAHLLVVDDEPHVSMIIEQACRADGHRVSSARSLGEARALLESGDHFDLVFLDIGLPDGSGLDFVDELAAADAAKDAPIVILTGAGYDDVLRRAMEAGARCVTKPFSPSKLRRLVGEILNNPADPS